MLITLQGVKFVKQWVMVHSMLLKLTWNKELGTGAGFEQEDGKPYTRV
jgi:hypothetical protein